MGPPRERGGVMELTEAFQAAAALQWGRRANAAECELAARLGIKEFRLQWGRRANAAECSSMLATSTRCGVLQWGRRANAAECDRELGKRERR